MTHATVALYRHVFSSRGVVRVGKLGSTQQGSTWVGLLSPAGVWIRFPWGWAGGVGQHARRLDAHSDPRREKTNDVTHRDKLTHRATQSPRHNTSTSTNSAPQLCPRHVWLQSSLVSSFIHMLPWFLSQGGYGARFRGACAWGARARTVGVHTRCGVSVVRVDRHFFRVWG